MAFGDPKTTPNEFKKTARGFLKSKDKGMPLVKNSEYTFFKKKVRLNVVEKKVHKFAQEKDEIK